MHARENIVSPARLRPRHLPLDAQPSNSNRASAGKRQFTGEERDFSTLLAPEWRTFRLSNLLSWRDILRHDFCSGGELCGPEPAARTERASGQAWAGRSLVYESRFQFCAPPGYPDEPHQLHFSAPPVGQTPRMTTAE